MKKIIVMGSSNVDMVVKSPYLPTPGETILGGQFMMNQGGKGANQAIAVKRLGGELIFVAKLGNDILGQQTIEHFKREGIDTKYIIMDENAATGVALINVDNYAENSIVVASGANMTLNETDVNKVLGKISEGDFLLMQLESPINTVLYAAKKAYEKGAKVILNPAPACNIPSEMFKYLYMLTPNKIESEMLTGVEINNQEDLELVAQKIYDMGVQNVIITLGSGGCWVKEKNSSYHIDTFKVTPIDTTAAGDTFNGALCVGLAEDMNLKNAVSMAAKASSIAVTRMGAQASIPHRKELLDV